jgi:hypothetical protein
MGPLVNGTVDQRRLLRTVDVLARRERLSMLEIENAMLSPSLLTEAGFEQVRDWTYLVTLSADESVMWLSLESECRNRIRKSERAGVRVEIADDAGVVDEYYDLYEHLMRRKGRRAPFDRKMVRLLFDRLHKSDNILALRARDAAGRVIAVGLFPHDDETIYFWSGASDETAHALCPNDVLHWTAMHLAARRGLRSYNMSGYGRFKRKFGGTLVEDFALAQMLQRAARWARHGYRYWFEYKSTFDPRRLGSRRAPGHGTNGVRAAATAKAARELPMPVLRQRPTFRVSDIYRAPLHDFPIRDEILFQHLPLKPTWICWKSAPGAGSRPSGCRDRYAPSRSGRRRRQRQSASPGARSHPESAIRLRRRLQARAGRQPRPHVRRGVRDRGLRAPARSHHVPREPGGSDEAWRTRAHPVPELSAGALAGADTLHDQARARHALEEAGFSRWSIAAIRLRPHARYLYNYLHEKPIRAIGGGGAGHSQDGALVYDQSWTFRTVTGCSRSRSRCTRRGRSCRRPSMRGAPRSSTGTRCPSIINHNLLVVAQR